MSEQSEEQGNDVQTDDVEGHKVPFAQPPSDTERDGDDVEGHKVPFVQPPRDTDNQGNQF